MRGTAWDVVRQSRDPIGKGRQQASFTAYQVETVEEKVWSGRCGDVFYTRTHMFFRKLGLQERLEQIHSPGNEYGPPFAASETSRHGNAHRGEDSGFRPSPIDMGAGFRHTDH